jgi:hypothetical protein
MAHSCPDGKEDHGLLSFEIDPFKGAEKSMKKSSEPASPDPRASQPSILWFYNVLTT